MKILFGRIPGVIIMYVLAYWKKLRIALRIRTAHDFRVISARTLALARAKRKRFPSIKLSSIAK